ncbi:divergent polysaccharide deacetylase family protein [Marinobacteraceae bacterium S3BR75-40.1]
MPSVRRGAAPWGAALLFLVLTVFTGQALAEHSPPTIAIIIDDMGHNQGQDERLVDLDYPLTLAFLPFRPYTDKLAREAYRHGKEIMLHAPMANTIGLQLGAGALTPDMSRDQVIQVLRRSLQAIPHVRGVNNHMGSLLTQLQSQMDWVMQEVEKYPLYFVDSRTIATTVAAKTAEAHRIPTVSRDVFLDHQQTEEYIDRQFRKLIAIARLKGSAVAIGHPHPVTIDYLKKALPELDRQGIAVATVSALWRLRHDNRDLYQAGRQPVHQHLAQKPEAE